MRVTCPNWCEVSGPIPILLTRPKRRARKREPPDDDTDAEWRPADSYVNDPCGMFDGLERRERI